MDAQLPALATTLRSARQSRDISREQLSEMVGVSVKSIQRYEEGRQTPRVDTLHRLAEALKIPVGDLVGSSESSQVLPMLKTILDQLGALTAEVRELRAGLSQPTK